MRSHATLNKYEIKVNKVLHLLHGNVLKQNVTGVKFTDDADMPLILTFISI